MAGLSSSVPSISLAVHAPVVPPRRRIRNNPATTTTPALQRRCHTGLMVNSSGMNNAGSPIKGDTRIFAVDPGSVDPTPIPGTPTLPIPGIPSLPIPGVPQWAQWLVGAFVFAVPLYRQFRAMEDKIERTAEVAIEVIDKVAEETEKIADGFADAFPENEMVKEAASRIKAVAEEIEEDADKAEALIDKVDEIKKEMDSIVDKIVKEKP